MSPETRVLVVGTTPDYVHWIDCTWPGRAVFVTDPGVRKGAVEPAPDRRTELVVDLRHPRRVHEALAEHLRRHAIQPAGIACFDCEAMPLAAMLAEWLSLPYPSGKAVGLCRDKFLCKQAWRAAGVPCPEASVISRSEEAIAFLHRTGRPCVLKPLTGAGSELVFLCHTPAEAARAVRQIRKGLDRLQQNRLYAGSGMRMVAEEYVAGPEYSCDFLLDEDRVRIVRVARKIRLHDGPFGITRGYIVPGDLPGGLTLTRLRDALRKSANALGLARALCMVDFIATPDGPVLLEIAPRPGGDCLPPLIRAAAGLDMLGLALDVAEGRSIRLPKPDQWTRHVAFRIFARREGVLRGVDFARVQADHRVRQVHLIRRPGQAVVLPPRNYDLWILGHVIFHPEADREIEPQCDELLAGVDMTFSGEA